MNSKKPNRKSFGLTFDPAIYQEYRAMCDALGTTMSRRLERYMRRELAAYRHKEKKKEDE
jgi:hypothetical protein